MGKNYKFTQRAEKELNEAIDWYEEQKKGLGEEFAVEVFQKVEQISEHPESHSIIYKDVRRASLKKFPFFIYYALRNTIVFILSIWHKKRKISSLE